MSRLSFRKPQRSGTVIGMLFAGIVVLCARALLPPWLQHAVSGSTVEAALFRTMSLPGVDVLYPRPPGESVAELTRLVDSAPKEIALLSLRAHQEENALDFAAAERDWKAYAAQASDHGAAEMELASFYGRRLAVGDQFATLLTVGASPPVPQDAVTAPASQRSWTAFEQALTVARTQSFAPAVVQPLWDSWISRYPLQSTVYARAFTWELNNKRTVEARAVVAKFQTAFPADRPFVLKTEALLQLQGGGPEAGLRALAVYDKGFSPLWPEDLANSYFDLLAATHNTRRFVAEAQARLAKDPDDLNAAARLFAYHRHGGHPEAALAVLAAYRDSKEQRDPAGKNWTPDELGTLEQLTASAKAYPDAARYAFALFHMPGKVADGRSAEETGLAAMVGLLLDGPEQPIALGAGNLSMYRDIASADAGPGFWNGVLSLWLNDEALRDQFTQQEAKAQPYFHRAEAAALLKLLDERAPGNPQRSSLHAKLIEAYAAYGEDTALLGEGETFLRSFSSGMDHVSVALAMADAQARRKDTAAEFAVYDKLLLELAQQAGNLPLATAALATATPPDSTAVGASAEVEVRNSDLDTQETAHEDSNPQTRPSTTQAFDLNTGPPTPAASPAATAYAEILDRYLGRLTSMHQLPQALAVLRKELDRNPNDPRLYEKLATFLGQNDLSAQEEEVYRAAIAKFDDKSWYDKLARFYLRSRRDQDFGKLTRQVTDIFSGMDLDAYFAGVRGGGPQLGLQLNLYAHKRFPHDLVFTGNLLAAYRAQPTANPAAWERLLRETWWETPELTNQFFAFLSSSGKLRAELASLPAGVDPANPAALQERAEAALWASHFEASAPLFDQLAQGYPADANLGTTAADLHRSLAWLDPAGPAAHIQQAVAIEQRLLSTSPGDLERLARIGDILSDHADGSPASYQPAAVFWHRMPGTAPGDGDAYLQAATVFWDYFQFDEALGEINQARAHFGDPVLYGYEAGAIFEGKRDFAGAIREYTAAALAPTAATAAPDAADKAVATVRNAGSSVDVSLLSNPSAVRLLELARRPDTAPLVDRSVEASRKENGSLAALQLRVAVLEAEHRGAQAPPLLIAAVARATTADAEADLVAFAQTRNDQPAREAALTREADLTPDPTEKLELRYGLVQALEARNDLPSAERLVDQTYRDNPRILGVVRSTVDFDWRHGRQKQAVDVLVDAAHAAQPPLMEQFTAEAAAKSNENGDTARARQLALSLLNKDPYNPQYLSLTAESYARANDAAGLEAFYEQRLEAVRSSPMTADERRSRTALLRKGLIPALTQAKNYSGAVDQYIALVSAYPEDSGLIREAALYAADHEQRPRLLAFYAQTVQSSPRDARYLIALAQTQALFGDAPAALEAYRHAVALRPERSDLFIAKAALEDRLGRYSEAVGDYNRLYQLSYKDPQWMLAAAKAQARQGHTGDAVHALETAYLHGPQSTPHERFQVAAQLEQWNLLPEAQRYAEQGASAAGNDLLAGEAPGIATEDAAIYARILTRTRHTAEVFSTLRSALAAAAQSTPSSASTLAAQVQAQGLASVSDDDWRKSFVKARRARASAAFNSALIAMGEAVATYGTPEEHTAFVAELQRQRGTASRNELIERWIPVARAADLGALEASWRADALKTHGEQITALVQLQGARLSFGELGRTLDSYVRTHPRSRERAQALSEGVNAYGAASELTAQVRLLQAAWSGSDNILGAPGPYLDLLAQRSPETLVTLAASKQEAIANAAVEAALDAPSPGLALRAIGVRGGTLGDAWTLNYTALGGLYAHAEPSVVGAAFDRSLELGMTVGERIATPADTRKGLAGKPWFYMAGRYGEWLLANPATSLPADDVLPADLEAGANPAAYLALARTQAEAGIRDAALGSTGHALELDPTSEDALDLQATLLWDLHRRPEAIANWTRALEALQAMEQSGPAPESFWTGFARIAFRAHEHDLYRQLKPALDATLRSYLSHNGTYRSSELLRAAYDAAPDSTEGTAWLLSLAGAAKDASEVLGAVDNAQWLPELARETLLQRELTLARTSGATAAETADESGRLAAVRTRLIQLYLENHQGGQALALLATEPPSVRAKRPAQEAEIVASAQTGTLPSLLAHFESDPEKAPDKQALSEAAATLSRENDWTSTRRVREFSLARAQKTRDALSSDFLAVAEARLHTRDSKGAASVLQAMVTASDDLDADRDSAAALLEQNGQLAEAIPFLEALTRSVPWEASYAVGLAEARMAAGRGGEDAAQQLTAEASNPAVPYPVRARAARDLGNAHAPAHALGTGELTLLAAGAATPASSRQPFYTAARVAAASTSTDLKVQASLLREAVAIAPFADHAQDLRERIFEAEERAGNYPAARATLASIVTQQNSYISTISADTGDAGNDLNGPVASEGEVPLPQALHNAPQERRAAFAREVATAYAATGDRGLARSYLLYAENLTAAKPELDAIRQQLATLVAQGRLAAANAARRPRIANQPDQLRTVRARLTVAPDVFTPGAEANDE